MLCVPNMVMIGGNSRNSGKTTIACNIIRKLSVTHEVIGLKVTSIRPGETGMHGKHDEDITTNYSIFEEINSESDKDTAKMLRAGATHVYYIRVSGAFVEPAILHLLSKYINNQVIVCESRSLRNIITPGLFVMMLRDVSKEESKDVTVYLEKADAIFNAFNHQTEIQLFNNSLNYIDGHFNFIKN
jgi:hypothetical protein